MAYIYDDSQTYTGEIVNFTSTDKAKITSISVPITYTQDLHGYANPWPAGGGVNKIGIPDGVDFTLRGVRYYTDAGSLYMDGTSTGETSSASAAFKTNFSFTLQPGYYYFSRLSYNRPVYLISDSGTLATNSGTFTIAEPTVVWVGFYIYNAVFDNKQCPIIITGSSAPSEYSPFSNICPISGLTGLSVYVSPTQDPDDATVYNAEWSTQAGTVYGGTLDVVSGELTVDMVNIPSYNGETINDPWLSSMDAYAEGTTPTIGAQVVYTLATPLTYQLTPKQIAALTENYVWASNRASITVTVSDVLQNFQGWLLKVGSDMTLVPTDMIKAETYKVSPNQRMEETAERDSTGVLWRETVPNMPPKIEFNTPAAYDTDVNALNAIFRAAYSNEQERKLTVAFYDPEENVYKSWECYMPNIDFPIRTIDIDAKTIFYDEIRYAFIGY